MFGYIYKTTNKVNNKIYVGKKISDVFIGEKYLGSGKYLKSAVKKYGRNSFTVEMIDTAESNEELNEKEIYWIEKLNCRDHLVGYNISVGGDGVSGIPAWNKGLVKETDDRLLVSEETRKKHSESLKKAYKEGRRSKISGGWKTRKRTPEMNEQNRIRNLGKRWMFRYLENGELEEVIVYPKDIECFISNGYSFGRPSSSKTLNDYNQKKRTDPIEKYRLSEARKELIKKKGHSGYYGLKGKEHPRCTYDLAKSIANQEFYDYWFENGKCKTMKHFSIGEKTYKYCCDILNIVETEEHLFRIRSNARKTL